MEQKTPEVYAAICRVTKAIGYDGITKDKKNEQQGYKFRGIDDLYNALNAVLAGAELCIMPRMISRTSEERPTAKGGVLFYVTVEAEYDFISAKDGSRHTAKVFGEAMDSADKATNKAMSAAYKYCCMQTFCIPTEGMAEDADAHTPEPAPRQQARPVSVPKAPPMDTEAQLRASIKEALGKMYDKYAVLSQGPAFFQVLGNNGYTSIAEIPADHQKAKVVIDDLKATLKGFQGSAA